MSRVDGELLRAVMRSVPSPVTVVTVKGETEIRGITIGSFTSTSLHPPLVSFNVDLRAQIYDALSVADRFAVHVLNEHQAQLADHFATPDLTGEEQFDDVPYRLDALGTPILLDALAVIHCRRHAVHDAGDHSIILGRVIGIDDGNDGSPMIYFDRTYRRVGQAVQSTFFEPVHEPGEER